jgi:hypothetical protein
MKQELGISFTEEGFPLITGRGIADFGLDEVILSPRLRTFLRSLTNEAYCVCDYHFDEHGPNGECPDWRELGRPKP